ncbi:MAG: hypothetical protein GY787_03410 [Alteromonadales bacterium]|nr:hypothetical protein [Alteromonadales bacterium]
MAVRINLVESNTTDIPGATAATFNRGFSLPGGAVDEVIMRITTTNTTNAILADFGNIIQSLRLVLNGSTVFDFRSGYSSAANNAASQFGYFLNSLGSGRAVEVPGDLTKEAYFRIPIGRNIPAGVSRMEYTLSYSATAAAVASGTCEFFVRYNDNMATTTTVSSSTSFNHSISEQQVVVRLPQGVPGVVAGIMIQNDSAADELTGIRVISQSDFSLSESMFRAFNGDLYNGIVYADDDASTTAQQYAVKCAGGLFLPTFGLSMDSDVILQVNSSAVSTRTYTPVIVAPINGAAESQGRQTQPVITNTNQSVLAATTETV